MGVPQGAAPRCPSLSVPPSMGVSTSWAPAQGPCPVWEESGVGKTPGIPRPSGTLSWTVTVENCQGPPSAPPGDDPCPPQTLPRANTTSQGALTQQMSTHMACRVLSPGTSPGVSAGSPRGESCSCVHHPLLAGQTDTWMQGLPSLRESHALTDDW